MEEAENECDKGSRAAESQKLVTVLSIQLSNRLFLKQKPHMQQ